MRILVVEHKQEIGRIWKRQIESGGLACDLVHSQSDALRALSRTSYEVVVTDLELRDGSALAVADFAASRNPATKVIFVTASTFFSDGAIFEFMDNVCALVPQCTRPDDMAALVEYHAR